MCFSKKLSSPCCLRFSARHLLFDFLFDKTVPSGWLCPPKVTGSFNTDPSDQKPEQNKQGQICLIVIAVCIIICKKIS